MLARIVLGAVTAVATFAPAIAGSMNADEARRFVAGKVFAFTCFDGTRGAGRILEETQSAADGTLQHKIVYNYDLSGKQTGYSIFDASGKLVGGKGAAIVHASPSPKPREKTRR